MEQDSPSAAVSRARIVWDLAMVVLAVLSLALIAWVEIAQLTWPQPRFKMLAAIDLAIVAVFFAEFVVRLVRSDARARFLREHWIELLGLVPLYAESWSWLRVARLVRIVRVFRLFRAVSAYRRLRSARFLDAVLVRSKLGHALAVSGVIVLGMASVVWILERGVNEDLATFSDALWWAVVTVTTVGYGDITPQTGLARVFAGTLMLLGIGLIGMVTSSLSSALLTVGTSESEPPVDRGQDVAGQLEKLAALRERGAITAEEFAQAKRKVLES